jgi:putative pyruvate formate lyase activating enzyme
MKCSITFGLMKEPHSPKRFRIASRSWEPAYQSLYRSGELAQRVQTALSSLQSCRVCPRNCEVDRLAGEEGVCKTGRYAWVSSYGPHLGEEDCLRGRRGSGTIFFSMCNLRCVFCQNYDISQQRGGAAAPPEHIAAMMLELQKRGCHNINWVTPEHVVPQALEALLLAVEEGLRLPIVYNTSAYDSIESLRLLDGVIDIYMPDFKFWDPRLALHYLKAKNYPEVARQAILEMHRQVGPLTVDEDGIARRGVLVRHLVMPGFVEESEAILRFLARDVSLDTYVNIMDQYYPSGKVSSSQYAEINRRLWPEELHMVEDAARRVGLWRFDRRRSLS